jgi:proteasome lid subunit RPN8/RPN11
VSAGGGVRIEPDVVRAIIRHARRERPRECCGLLVGRGRRVAHAVPMRNTARGTSRFRLDDRGHIDLRRQLRGWVPAMEIVGVYHSHPSGAAVPSARDLREAFYAGWVHVIAGLHPRAAVRAYEIRRGRARALRMIATRF